MNRRAGVAVPAMLTVLSSLVACSGSGDKPKPTTTVPAPSSSTSFTIVTVPGNPRSTTTLPVDISPGEATISGTVGTPEGPVPDAIVRIERLTGDEVARVDVRAVSGGWQLASIRGGRYRVRAWRPPDMAQLEPEVFFLGSTETKQLPLLLNHFGDVSVTANSDPSPMPVGQPAVLVTQVLMGAVDTEGVVRANPRTGVPTQLVAAAGLALDGLDKQVTDGEGNNGWRVRCLAAGPPSVALVVESVSYAIILPPCTG
ncbi:MAG TPA: hypothetical protein VF711_10685 [Acidimicrobiales bacterium]